MLLYFSLIIISQIFIANSDLVEENKFINDLKDDEKQDFIERIVRRLNKEINPKEIPKEESKKISDDQLDEHSDFVKKIVEEEKAHFERGIKDKGPEPRRLSNQSYIDFTLKEQTRKKRNENIVRENIQTTEVNEVTIPVQVIYDADPNKSNISRSVEKDDIQVKGDSLNLRKSNYQEDEIETVTESSRKFHDSKDNTNEKDSSDKLKESDARKSVTETNDENKSTVVSSEHNDIKTTAVTSTKKEKSDEIKFETTTINNGYDQTKTRRDSKRSQKYLSKDNVTASTKLEAKVQNENTTLIKDAEDNVNYNNTPKNQELRSVKSDLTPEPKQEVDELNLTTTLKPELDSTTIKIPDTAKFRENIKQNKINDLTLTYETEKVDLNQESKGKNAKVGLLKEEPTNKNILRSRLSTVKLKDIFDKRNPTDEENEKLKTLQIAEDVVKALRMRIERDIKNKKLVKKRKSKPKSRKVKIYGLRSFDEDKTVESNKNNKEEPYYVPIYNYNPDNAFYNAYNKFGPNYVDSKENKANELHRTVNIQDLSSDKYARSYFEKPIKLNKRQPSNKVKYDIVPNIIQKTYRNIDNDEVAKLETSINEADGHLKSYLKRIRQAYQLQKENKRVKDRKLNKGTTYLDDSVKYYFENFNKKAFRKPSSHYHDISHDYIGDFRIEDPKNDDKLRNAYRIPKDEYPIKSGMEVRTGNKKEKITEFRELLKTLQHVFPSLKKFVNVDNDVNEQVEASVKVMRDMINRDDEGLEQYDWLESTVNIQSAIKKLLDLTRARIEGLEMHPSDLELLKFTTYLFTLAYIDFQDELKPFPISRAVSPKSHVAKGHFVNHKQVLKDSNKWLYRVPDPRKGYQYEYELLRHFLNDLSDSLFDLHNAVKHVGLVTNFRSQRWFVNLKDLYLHDPNRRKLLQVILHLGTTRLFNLIEDSCDNGASTNFRRYIHENQTMVSAVKEAFVYVLKFLKAV